MIMWQIKFSEFYSMLKLILLILCFLYKFFKKYNLNFQSSELINIFSEIKKKCIPTSTSSNHMEEIMPMWIIQEVNQTHINKMHMYRVTPTNITIIPIFSNRSLCITAANSNRIDHCQKINIMSHKINFSKAHCKKALEPDLWEKFIHYCPSSYFSQLLSGYGHTTAQFSKLFSSIYQWSSFSQLFLWHYPASSAVQFNLSENMRSLYLLSSH